MRTIDQVQVGRAKEMRLLVLGISRTGTSSICIALEKLGYKTFHMNACLARPKFFFPLWIEALNAKFRGLGKAFGRAEFDKVLGDYDAVSDIPAALFAEELIKAYPDARVVLTTRGTQKWATSMQSTIWLVHSWSSWDILAPFHTLIGAWRRCDTIDWDCFVGQFGRRDYLSPEYRKLAMKRFDEHNDHVRSIVPKGNLLEFRPQDGWKPLCDFLGHEIPIAEYPHAWDADDLVKMAKFLWWVGVGTMLLKLGTPVAVAAGLWYWFNY